MAVSYILSQAGRKMGLNPNDTTQRTTLLRFLNEAAREVYDQCDMPGSLMEQAFKVNGDQTISLPSYVGYVRAARELAAQNPWHINKMRPRYNQFNWQDMWRNLRLRNKQALMVSVTNQSIGVITVTAIDNPPISVSVTGPTANATAVSETIVIDALTKTTVNQFLDYTSVTKSAVNGCDVTLSDVDGKVLTVIPNNELEAEYQIIDVSACPWLPNSTSPIDNYLEILYKKKLAILSLDTDCFPAPDYDDILVNKILQLWAEEQEKPEVALAYDAKATRSMARKQQEQNKETEDVVALQANPHDTLQGRIAGNSRRRWGWGRLGGW